MRYKGAWGWGQTAQNKRDVLLAISTTSKKYLPYKKLLWCGLYSMERNMTLRCDLSKKKCVGHQGELGKVTRERWLDVELKIITSSIVPIKIE